MFKIISELGNNHFIDIFVPESLINNFPISPSNRIRIIPRRNKNFIECLDNSASMYDNDDKNLVWINSRFIGLDFELITESEKLKEKNNLDILFSCDKNTYLIADQENNFMNILKEKNIDKVFFDRSNLEEIKIFNRKFFVISKSSISLLTNKNKLRYDFSHLIVVFLLTP